MRLKVILAISAIGLLAACGKTVETPIETVEPVVEPVVEEEPEEVAEEIVEEEEPTFEDATFVQTGEYEYTLYIDCPDMSNTLGEELLNTLGRGGTVKGVSEIYGISENLLRSVLAHGIQIDPSRPNEIDYNLWKDKPIIDIQMLYAIATFSFVLTDDPSAYEDVWAYPEDDLIYKGDWDTWIEVCHVCATYLKDCLIYTNGNIPCALMRYHIGPDAWEQAMEECMSATGLTAEEIYAHYDSSYVLQYDTLGLGDPNYVNEVLQYVGNDPIVIQYFDESFNIASEDTYTLVRP